MTIDSAVLPFEFNVGDKVANTFSGNQGTVVKRHFIGDLSGCGFYRTLDEIEDSRSLLSLETGIELVKLPEA